MTEATGRLVLNAGVCSDTGRVRATNQDSYAILSDLGLYIVADGMGGAQGGEVASRIAIETIRDAFQERTAQSLTDAVAQANQRIHEAGDAHDLRGMGTTAVAMAVVTEDEDPDVPEGDADGERPEHLLVVNVGDSRAYLFRGGGLTQLTDDHSVVAELVRDGRITAEEAEAHPQRNVITRVLGVYPQVTADLWPVDAVRGDRYLLCSDGLFNEVSIDQMAAVLRRLSDPNDAAAELVRLANEGGGRDNITVLVLDVVDDGGVAGRASAALAGERRGASSVDLAGFSTAPDQDADRAPAASSEPGRRERRAARKAERNGRSRLTWRVVLFTVLLLAVLGGAVATIQWYGTSTYFVAFDGDEVAIYKGRPGGLLWIDPELVQDTAIKRDEVPARYLRALDTGHEHPSLAEARTYVSNIERDIIASTPPPTTTTAPPPVTTVAPPAPAPVN